VLFTAHSVPERTVAPDSSGMPADPYADEARRTAALVADAVTAEALTAEAPAALAAGWRFAFQSQGMSGGPWLGPTVEETLRELRDAGHSAVLMQPIGFLCDHVEILYDIDIGFRQYGEQLGLRVERTESLNTSPTLIAALADLSRAALERLRAARVA
jgi:ferrochelatase